jgi:(p)ppGpp synthase/HD superfamily hydrolase
MISLAPEVRVDAKKISAAFEFAKRAHAGQSRFSGAPFLEHPKAVAELCLVVKEDTNLICAALLHDVLEDTNTPPSVIEYEFGEDVVNLVLAVTKNNALPKSVQDVALHANVVRASKKDSRVLILKLMDVLHNLETCSVLPEHRCKGVVHMAEHFYYPLIGEVELNGLEERFEKALFAAREYV